MINDNFKWKKKQSRCNGLDVMRMYLTDVRNGSNKSIADFSKKGDKCCLSLNIFFKLYELELQTNTYYKIFTKNFINEYFKGCRYILDTQIIGNVMNYQLFIGVNDMPSNEFMKDMYFDITTVDYILAERVYRKNLMKTISNS